MSLFELISSLFSYIFITIIYLFIFSIIRLIYMDIQLMGKRDNKAYDNEAEDEQEESFDGDYFGVLKVIAAKEGVKNLSDAYILDETAVIIGRSGGDCDIEIEDEFLSAQHLELKFDGNNWYAEDLQSSNGTFINGASIGDRVKRLRNGDEISIGSLVFELVGV